MQENARVGLQGRTDALADDRQVAPVILEAVGKGFGQDGSSHRTSNGRIP